MPAPIAPCLWFEGNAEEAVNYYISVFKNSSITAIDRWGENGPGPDSPVIFIEFQINGQPFQAINGGPDFTHFTEAISFSIVCDDQEEADYYWDALTANGGEPSQCGWLKDRYGVSWQIVPREYFELSRHPDHVRAGQAVRRMLEMTRIDVAELRAAFNQ